MRSARTIGLEIARWACVFALALFFVLRAAGAEVSTADFSAVSAAVSSGMEKENVEEGTNQMIRRLYGLNPEDYEGILLYYPKTNMAAEELFLVKLKSVDQQDSVREAVEKRLATQKKNFDGYGTYQYGMLSDAVIDVKGNYILFISSKNPDEIDAAFKKSL